MRAKVTYPFTDRETGEVRYRGDALELAADRFRELSLGGFVEEADEEGPAPGPVPAAETGAPEEADKAAPEPTCAELRAAIEAKGGFAPRKATKAQLAEILGTL